MFFHDPSLRESKTLAPGVLARTFWGEKMLAAVVYLDQNAEVPSHSHPHEQMGIVLEGTIELTIGGEAKTLNPHEVYLIPGDVGHSAKTFDHPVKILDVFSPVRDEYKY